MQAKSFSVILMVLISVSAFGAGPGSSGGGEPCERKIKAVRDDIAKWIRDGGPAYLSFNGQVTADQYSAAMLDYIKNAHISCVGPNDPGYPIAIDGTPKLCLWNKVGADSAIRCDRERVESSGTEEFYKDVHHEYASLSGFEPPNGADSDYKLSNQISGFITYQLVPQLAIRRPIKEGEAYISRYEGYNGDVHKSVSIKGGPGWEVVRSWNHYTWLNFSGAPYGEKQTVVCFVKSSDNGLQHHQSYFGIAFKEEDIRKALIAIVVDDRQPPPRNIECMSRDEFFAKYPHDLDKFFEQIDP